MSILLSQNFERKELCNNMLNCNFLIQSLVVIRKILKIFDGIVYTMAPFVFNCLTMGKFFIN